MGMQLYPQIGTMTERNENKEVNIVQLIHADKILKKTPLSKSLKNIGNKIVKWEYQ